MKNYVFNLLAACFLLAGLSGDATAQGVINLGPGDVITSGTVIDDGTTVNVIGGTIETNVDLSNGELNISSGSVALGANGTGGAGSGFTNVGNLVNLSGGDVGGFFQLTDTIFNISGGTIESFGLFDAATEVNISGGTVTRFPDIFTGTVNISGGDVFAIRLFAGGTVNFFGDNFTLDGQEISLAVGETIELDQRNQLLGGTLEDGTVFSHELTTTFGGFFDAEPGGFSAAGTLLLTRVAAVPEPSAMVLFGFAGVLAVSRRRRA